MTKLSSLQQARLKYQPKLPKILRESFDHISIKKGEATTAAANVTEIQQLFAHSFGAPIVEFVAGQSQALARPLSVGVILSGGQAPGGHNVIAGLFDGLKKAHKDSKLYGFLGGPAGIIEGHYQELTVATIDAYRNTGGFDMIQSGRTKLESPQQFDQALANCQKLGLHSVVVIGGDDSNTNAAVLAEYFRAKNAGVQVIGCPKTIDGDLKNMMIETSFGFDTACKTYSELIGNIARDANSAQKYWHFIKLMGRSASHIALECALQTQPNVCIISEEVAAKKMTLNQVVDHIVQSVAYRGNKGQNFGLVLIPEGLVEFIPEMNALIAELNDLLGHHADEFAALFDIDAQRTWAQSHLSKASQDTYQSLPADIQMQLIMDRDPHGNVQVSAIETEKLLISMVKKQLKVLKDAGQYQGKFSAIGHFFGYEGRCAFPSNFDADYCYSLGYTAFMLIAHGLTGYISSVRNLEKPADQWVAGGAPLTMMMNVEQRHGQPKPVIRKALVELDGAPFKAFVQQRDVWAKESQYVFPGAIQYFGASEVCDMPTQTLILEKK
jgi:pyrophosphate--fructose-6-phosphate 1-phosphotransferase